MPARLFCAGASEVGEVVGDGGVAVEAHFLAQAVAGHFDAFVGYVHKGRYLLAAETHLEVAGEAHIGWRELRIALAQALCVVAGRDVGVAVEGVLVVVVADVFLDGCLDVAELALCGFVERGEFLYLGYFRGYLVQNLVFADEVHGGVAELGALVLDVYFELVGLEFGYLVVFLQGFALGGAAHFREFFFFLFFRAPLGVEFPAAQHVGKAYHERDEQERVHEHGHDGAVPRGRDAEGEAGFGFFAGVAVVGAQMQRVCAFVQLGVFAGRFGGVGAPVFVVMLQV